MHSGNATKTSLTKGRKTTPKSSASSNAKSVSSPQTAKASPAEKSSPAAQRAKKTVVSAPGASAPPQSSVAEKPISHGQIAELAYSYYVGRNFKHGHAEEDWHRAHSELRVAAAAAK